MNTKKPNTDQTKNNTSLSSDLSSNSSPPPSSSPSSPSSSSQSPASSSLSPSLSSQSPPSRRNSLHESFASISVPHSSAGFWRKFLAFSGPGMMIAVGYMDPGNWATGIAGGARFGYSLLSVILISNLMAVLLQHLSLKLGIASGRDLAQACRDQYSKPVTLILWLLCEIAITACDLAEVIGSAVALKLLFGLPIVAGVILTALDVMIILYLQHRGFRLLEIIVTSLILLIGGCFAYEIIASHPSIPLILKNLLPKKEIITNPEMLYIAVGILGATVMPHNLYLHSSIVQTRAFTRDESGKKMAIRYASLDSTLALFCALLINAAILILSASAFHSSGHAEVADIDEAYRLLTPVMAAPLASFLFAIALLASGHNSTLTGTLAGQIVMEGFLDLRLRPWVRRILTRLLAIVPAVLVASFYGDHGIQQLLILSQVILSLQLSFAVVPLVLFTNNKSIMGEHANRWLVKTLAALTTVIIVVLNGYLFFKTVF